MRFSYYFIVSKYLYKESKCILIENIIIAFNIYSSLAKLR